MGVGSTLISMLILIFLHRCKTKSIINALDNTTIRFSEYLTITDQNPFTLILVQLKSYMFKSNLELALSIILNKENYISQSMFSKSVDV